MAKKKRKTGKKTLEKSVEELYNIMKDEELSEVKWEEENFKLKIRRRGAVSFVEKRPSSSADTEKSSEPQKPETNKDYIRSPMNGVFYRSPSPAEPPYVEENKVVSEGSTVCIIEAMKLMNEVQVEKPCRIKKILVDNASAVKVNQKLFEIEKA